MKMNLSIRDIECAEILVDKKSSLLNQVLVVGGDKLGDGDDKLGEILIKSYMFSLEKCPPYPKTILFLNSGVKLVVENSPVLDNLRAMESQGVEILSCGTCLDYYNLKDKLCVGGVTNMYAIVEMMNNAYNTIKL